VEEVNEQKWLAGSDADGMLRFLRFKVMEQLPRTGRISGRGCPVSERKLLLFGCACCRRVAGLVDFSLKDELHSAERCADQISSEISWASLVENELLFQTLMDVGAYFEDNDTLDYRPFEINAYFAVQNLLGGLAGLADCTRLAVRARTEYAMSLRADQHSPPETDEEYAEVEEREQKSAEAEQVRLMHEIFGNPFRPIIVPEAWQSTNDGIAIKMAQSIYESGRFGDLPILGDALEDGGCDNAEILAHCRGGGDHVRGCWVIDLLLGKE
jgi:hypothetical protein